MAEAGRKIVESEGLISPERKRQIRADLTYLQLFAFQGPRVTTGDRRRPLGQLDEKSVTDEYHLFKECEWEKVAIAMAHHGTIQGSKLSKDIVLRFYPLIEPVFPKGQDTLGERKGLIALETMLDDGRLSVLMAGYANYERQRHNCPTPTGFELEFSDLRAANRFFENLGNDPTATVNEYVSAAIGGVDGGRHAAFGGKWPSAIRYLGVRRHNDEMFQAEVTDQGVKITKHYRNIEELAGEIEKSEAKKPARPGRQTVDADGFPTSNEPPPPPGLYRGESKIAIPRRPEGYFSLVEKYGPLGYDGLNMEVQHNVPPPGKESAPVVENKGLVFDSSAATDVGKVREHNEDVVRIDEQNLRHMGIDGLYIVADGMGGHGAGEVASAIAADVIVSQCKKQEFPRQTQASDQLTPEQKLNFDRLVIERKLENELAQQQKLKNELILQEKQRQWLSAAVGQANHAVFERSKNSTDTAEKDMGTTLVVAIRSSDQVAVANVGDSRAYIISKDGRIIQQVTQDHSLVARLVVSNQITAEEARVHPQRNVIYRTIGDKPRVEADVFFAKIPQGGSMVLCSDGLSGMVDDGRIGGIVAYSGTAQEATRKLIDAANAAGGQDNISAIVVRNVAEVVQTKAAEAPEKSANLKTEKEWGETMKDILRNPIAQMVYLQTGSLTAAAVAFESRAEILSGKMAKEQYAALVKRVLEAGKI